jgi:hypothetical protein
MHHVVLPMSFVNSAIDPLVESKAFYFVVHPASFVRTAVYPSILTLATFLARLELTRVLRSLHPSFNSLSMLEIVFPLAYINRPVFMVVSPISFSFVVDPLAFVNITVTVPESAKSIDLIVFPFALIFTFIRPFLDTVTMTNAHFPVASVNGTRFEFIVVFHLQNSFIERYFICNCLTFRILRVILICLYSSTYIMFVQLITKYKRRILRLHIFT